jgi:hypothetical protein
MASDLRCPNCEDNLGKDTENSALAYCGNCGEDNIYNERGDKSDMNEEELSTFRSMKRKRNKNSVRIGRIL